MLTTFATYVVPFVIVLSVVVFFHEFGHFIVGRWCGVKVDAFSIGFGPELFARVDRHGTRWRVAAIPLGGYVKFHGDANAASGPDPDAVAAMPAAERAVTFAAQPVWKRAAIVFAGPFANFILAIAIFAGIFSYYGRTALVPRVGSVVAGGAGEKAGFKAGDLVLTIDGAPIPTFAKLQEIVSSSADARLLIVVRRGDADVTLEATPAWREVESAVGKVRIGMLGLKASTAPADVREERFGPLGSVVAAVEETWQVVHRTGSYLGGLISGRESAEQLSGPIGIAQISGHMAQAAPKVGLGPFLNLIAILSVSVGLLNLMPVPLLDGGHLLFFGIEAIRGQALNERAQEVAFRLGLAMVGTLMIFSTYNDIARLIQRFAGGAS
ncbi:RIP metalloprotease [Methylocystis sp. IM3]|jgi:regulator of sigma E protease|uniref:M50 family metallopeptidase n=1 Tax=unclassified Methylocystis TaxID=2625913 RepID=UPI0030FAC1A9